MNVSEPEFTKARSLARDIMGSRGWAEAEICKYRPDTGGENYPTLYLDDLGAIPHLDDITGIEYYQQRARLRADTGDFIALTHQMDKDYEQYNQQYLGLGAPEIIQVNSHGYHPLNISRNLLNNMAQLSKLASAARKHGGLNVHPFMGSSDAWSLARRLDQLCPGLVRVIAPPPYLAEFVNDKTEFTTLVKSLLGDDAIVESRMAYNDDEVIAHLREMSHLYDCVALKMRNYASAMGNIVFESAGLKRLNSSELAKLVKPKLWELNWDGRSPVCVTRWYTDVLSSPSSHLWIPPKGESKPVVEGIFEQLLEGETKVFAGSRPARLKPELKDEITVKTQLLGIFLQELGYVGRCSFDLIVCKDNTVRFVECNGRWGGTSIPMAFYRRLFGQDAPLNYLARDVTDERLKGKSFRYLLELFNGQLYNAHTGKGIYILYNVGCLSSWGKFDVMVLGDSEAALEHRTSEIPAL